MYISIDRAIDKVQTQLKKYKNRLQDHHARKLDVFEVPVNIVRPSEELAEINDDIEAETARKLGEGYRFHQIVKKEKAPLKVLSWDEAIMKMELSGDAFLVFRNEEDKKIHVIYRREDGDFAILMPEG